MPLTGNSIDNNALASLTQRAGPQITSAIQKASLKTGVDFSYLMEKAAAESSFDADAQARTSSARGLYQFIESTWLQMVNRYGEKYGLEEYASQISDSGKVSSAALRREILSLRDDPEIAAMMAGEFASENKRSLVNSGIPEKDIGSTELYLAHFLGAGAASEFIKGMKENPLAPAADIFPRAAKANKNVFYNPKTHAARSFNEIHAFFDRKFSAAPAKDVTLVAENNNRKGPTDTQAENIAATSSIQINRFSPDMLAMISAEMNSDEADLYFGERLASAGKARPSLGSTRSLMADPVALMLMAGFDTNSAVSADEKRKENSRKDEVRNGSRESDLCDVLHLNQ